MAKYTFVLTGDELENGNAINNTGTDSFDVYGASNTIFEHGGNLSVTGGTQAPEGYDTNTTIVLDDTSGKSQANEKITVTLQGSDNALIGNDSFVAADAVAGPAFDDPSFGYAYLNDATVKYTVSGNGSAAGDNTVALFNSKGSTTINVAGTGNSITLNGSATNVVKAGSGSDVVTISDNFSANDGYPAANYTSKVTLAGSSNQVYGGDSMFTVSGGVNGNTVELGDGNDSVSLSGTKNSIEVGGGVDTITAGSGNDTVQILGLYSADYTTYPGPQSDSPATTIPTDQVTIAGTMDLVTATYENVVVSGSGATGKASISLGNGNDQVTLGGNGNAVNLGDGSLSGDNNVSLTGNNNTVIVNDGSGDTGLTNVSIGTGSGDDVSFGYSGGSVTGTGAGTTTVTQNTSSGANVTVSLGKGVGMVTLGNGNDSVTANGAGSSISAGNGNDTFTANGAGSNVSAGNGNDTVTANGANTSVTLGNGNDVVTANGTTKYGAGATVKVGNGNDTITANGNLASVTAGSGADTVTANGEYATVNLGSSGKPGGSDNVTSTGIGSQVTVYAKAGTTNTFTVGSNNTYLSVTGGVDTIASTGSGGDSNDDFYLNNAQLNSSLNLFGTNDLAFIGSDSSVNVSFGLANQYNEVTVQADSNNTYSGTVGLNGFGPGDTLDLQGLEDTSGHAFTSFSQVVADMTGTSNSETLDLNGGGKIVFGQQTAFNANEFAFSTSTGPVHP